MVKSKLALFWIVIFSIHTVFPALIKGTLVKTPDGFTPIEHLNIGNLILSPKGDQIIENRVVAIFPTRLFKLYNIRTPTAVLNVSSEQYIYDSMACKWIVASQISSRTHFLDAHCYTVPCLNCEYVEGEFLAYELLLGAPHTFFITPAEIVIHNFGPMIGLTLS